MLSINSNYSVLQLGPIGWVLHIHLVSPPVLLQLRVHTLHGLLGKEAKSMFSSFHLQKFLNMSLQDVNL